MVTTLAVVAPLLLLLGVPGYAEDHRRMYFRSATVGLGKPPPRHSRGMTVMSARIPRLTSDVARNWIVAGVALVVFFVTPLAIAILVGDVGEGALVAATTLLGWTFLALASAWSNWMVFRRADGETLARWLVATTPTTTWRRFVWSLNGGGAIAWAVTGSGIAIGAVVFLSQRAEFRSDALVVVPAILAVGSSIVMIISAYALRYARGNATEGGIEFRDTALPRFVDYFYLAVQVSTTFSSADVSITTSSMRRTVAIHSLFSFTFNTVIVALLVSLLVSAVG